MIVAGRLALALALVFSLGSVLFLALGVAWGRRDLLRNGYYAVLAFYVSCAVAAAVLLQAFLREDFSFGYVAGNSAAGLSAFYRVAGFWAGQQGSFLLWLLFIAVVAVVIAARDLRRLERLTGGAVMVLCATAAVFAALLSLDRGSDPFVAAEAGTQPYGLNPLLLHPAMVLHPPALFAGYVGLSVPFAFAVSTLLLGRGDALWVRRAQKWAVAGWLFLSLGIGLGAWWAYVVLSFGGYWAWDAVENTSLVPWLTATALLHSFLLYRTRGRLKRWALGLAAATFWLTILATWTTRTGLIQSVHAFDRRDLLVWILSGFLIAVAAVSIGLIVWRWRRFESHAEAESWLSREVLSHLLDLLLTLFAAAIAVTTVAVPLVSPGTAVVAGTYETVARPLGVLTVALVAVCPLLAWRRTDGAALRRALVLPVAVAAASVPLWLALGFGRDVWGLLGLVVCGFGLGAVVQAVAAAARRAAGPGRSPWSGLGRAVAGSRTRTPAWIVHLGIVLVVAGLLGSGLYRDEVSALVSAQPGAGAGIGGYTLTFRGMRAEAGAQGSTRTVASFVVSRDGKAVAVLEPRTDIYSSGMAAVRAVILGGWRQDLFVVADEPFDASTRQIALRMVLFPLIRLVWLGAILLVAGAAVSLWPGGRTQEQEARAAAAARAEPSDVTA